MEYFWEIFLLIIGTVQYNDNGAVFVIISNNDKSIWVFLEVLYICMYLYVCLLPLIGVLSKWRAVNMRAESRAKVEKICSIGTNFELDDNGDGENGEVVTVTLLFD